MKAAFIETIPLVVLLAASISAALLTASPALSQDPSDGTPVSIGTFRQLRSEVLSEDRSLLVCLPEEYEQGSLSYPVLFVLYGDQVRGYFAEAVHVVDRLSEEGSIPKMIIVGVANVDRYRDLSPVERQGRPSGIEPFSRFFVEELIPYIEREYRTKDFRVLLGPQAGAEFGLYALARRQGVFDGLILENPFRSPIVHSILIEAMRGLLDIGISSPTFLQITSADRAGRMDKTADIGYMRQFEGLIAEKNPPNLTLVTHYVEKSEDFLPPLRLHEGLRELFRDYSFPDDNPVEGLADIKSYYAALSGRLGFEVDIPERTLAAKAAELSRGAATDAAREILEYLIEVNPASLDGYWGLANLHRERGDRELAIRYYRKCLEIMPSMGPARDWIERLEAQPSTPGIGIHYLGHSSFVLSFDNGVTILTDYGQSNAYGLDSPIYDVGDFQPTVVAYSHHHPDHDRGQVFADAVAVDGEDLSLKGIEIRAIPVSEKSRGDNYGYLITYKGTTLFHAGDAQGDIVTLSDEAVRGRLKQDLPLRLDVLLVPIGWTRSITREAAAFVGFLQPKAVVPMHYWSAQEKADFLELLRSSDRDYTITEQGGSTWAVAISDASSSVQVISLKAGPSGE